MLETNELALILKQAEDMGLVNGYVTLHFANGRFHHPEFHINGGRRKSVDAITQLAQSVDN